MVLGDFTKELREFSVNYPSIKRHLIDRRDTYMSKNLVKMLRNNHDSRIVAIVGEGHVEGMKSKLSSLNPKIVSVTNINEVIANIISLGVRPSSNPNKGIRN